MEDNKYSRREFLSKKVLTGSLFVGGALVFGLSSLKSLAKDRSGRQPANPASRDSSQTPQQTKTPAQKPAARAVDPCEDMTGVSQADLDKRKKLAYTPKAPVPDKHCGNCNLFAKPKAGKTCGACALFKGPVNPQGACAYWAPIAT